MHSTHHFEPAPTAWERFRERYLDRGRGLLLALLVEALVILLLLTFVPSLAPQKKDKPLVFGFDDQKGDTADTKKDVKAKAKARAGGKSDQTKPVPVPPTPPVETPPPPETNQPAKVIWLTHQQYASSAISASHSQGTEAAATSDGTAAAGDSATAEGHGPHGEKLYRAEWWRRPTHAELQTYMPSRARPPGGWGEIACRTAPDHRVEDCQELADAPRGSGFAGAVRQAAFQFRVRAPRVGGKELIGSWVRIHIDYEITETRAPAKSDSAPIPEVPPLPDQN